MWIKSGLYAGAILLGTVVGASATPYYESLTGGATVGAVFNTTSVASSFETTSSKLSEVELALEKTSTLGTSGSIVITLNADSGGSPGNILYTLGTIADTALSAINTEYVFDLYGMGIVNLSTTSTYWIEITKVGSNQTKLQTYNNPSAPTIGATNPNTSSANLYDTKTTGSFSGSAVPPEMQLCVSADGSCSTNNGVTINYSMSETGVPEPATMAVLGTGLVGLGLSRRRGKAKQAALAQA